MAPNPMPWWARDGEVAQVVDKIAWRHAIVPARDDGLVHFLD